MRIADNKFEKGEDLCIEKV